MKGVIIMSKEIKDMLLGMHVPATPLSESVYADTDSIKEAQS